jgi:hypothetical protein
MEMDKVNQDRNTKIFNTPLESGLRALILLDAADKKPLDLHKLVFFDYLMTHSGDVDNGPESLHADIPHRLSAISLRRKLTTAGLDLMVSRDLVVKKFDPLNGVTFQVSGLANKFLSYFDSNYPKSLSERAHWVIKNFGSITPDELKSFFNSNFDRWNSEFSKEAFDRLVN